ncbi:hybrid sensor histidine kinase/response regulator [Ramlibacter tataouinensis]|nr:ATP-binding protein [Ramlibacter tataouinensis]
MLDSKQAMSVVWGDERILLYNDAYLPFLQEKHPAAFGQPLEQVWAEIWPQIGPLVDRARSGEAFQIDDMPLVLQRNGKRDPGWFTFFYAPLRDEDGRIQGMYSSVVETTARVLEEQRKTQLLELSDQRVAQRTAELEAARKEAVEFSQRLQFTLDAAEIGDWYLDLERDTAYRSRRHDQCFGYSEPIEEWGFEKFIAHVHPEDRAHVRRQFAEALSELKGWRFECRVVWPDQSVHWIAAHGFVHHMDRTPKTMTGIVLDITERKLNEQEIVHANARKDEYLAMLAHELRNPLAPISAAAAVLQLGARDEERVRKAAEVISRQVRHMTGIVNDLLDVSRVTRGKVALEKAPLDLKNVVASAIEQARPLIEARHHHLEVHLPPEPASVHGDFKRLVQVFANLLTNASKFTPDSGRIMVAIAVEAGQVRVTVADTGIGMEPALLGRAFDLFTQGERAADRSEGGLGIGLALVKSLVALHGGEVSAASEGPSRGSTFEVALPLLAQDADSGGPPDRPGQAPTGRPGLSILIVDDNRDAGDLLGLVCQTLGHSVQVVYGSAQALAHAEKVTHDVYLLDIGLPEMDGYALAARLRGTARAARFIAVTGYGMEQDKGIAKATGFDEYLVKPVDAGRLAELLAAEGPQK